MLVAVLDVLVLLGSGLAAGVLFAVAVSTAPALAAMTPDAYVHAHKLLGRNWDPTMPIIVLGSFAVDVALAALSSPAAAAALFAAAAALLAGVSVVSHFANVPINRQVSALEPGPVPPGWRDPRPLWRRWHLVRTVLATLALASNAAAVAVT
jgi:uncharacterized membrane protein